MAGLESHTGADRLTDNHNPLFPERCQRRADAQMHLWVKAWWAQRAEEWSVRDQQRKTRCERINKMTPTYTQRVATLPPHCRTVDQGELSRGDVSFGHRELRGAGERRWRIAL